MVAMIEYPELKEAIDSLPPVAQKELLDFVSYLRYKHHLDQAGSVVKLGGLWADLDFDVSDEDGRNLRRQLTLPLASKV
jgi:hypothetical protein